MKTYRTILFIIIAIGTLMMTSCSSSKKNMKLNNSESKIVTKMHKWDYHANVANKTINENVKLRTEDKKIAVAQQLAINENLKELNKPKHAKKAKNNGNMNMNTAFNFY